MAIKIAPGETRIGSDWDWRDGVEHVRASDRRRFCSDGVYADEAEGRRATQERGCLGRELRKRWHTEATSSFRSLVFRATFVK